MELQSISNYVKSMRKRYSLTQLELSQKSGVGLRFVRELEQGKPSLRLDKVAAILDLFGGELVVKQLNISAAESGDGQRKQCSEEVQQNDGGEGDE